MAIPEKPTPIEKFVQLIPLRYPLAAFAWTIILGPIGFRTANYLQSGATPFQSPNPVNEILGVLLGFYLYYIVRYLRLKIVAAEPQIAPILLGGEAAYHSAFGRVSSPRAIIILAVILEALALPVTNQGRTFSILSGYEVVTQVILILAFATLIWEYSAASWGLHKLGRSPLRLKSFLEDRFMGARSIGNVALSLTGAYLGGFLLFFLDSATFLKVTTDISIGSFYLILFALGVLMFFLPLNSIHRKMQEQKNLDQIGLGRQLLMIEPSGAAQTSNGPATIEKLDNGITHLIKLKEVEIAERKLASTPTWPFDIQLLAKLVTIVLSVTAVLLTRLITDYLIHI